VQASLHADRQHDKKVILEALSKEVLGTHKGLKGPELDLWIGDHFESTFAETQEDGEEAEAASDDEEADEADADAEEAEVRKPAEDNEELARAHRRDRGMRIEYTREPRNAETPKPRDYVQKLYN
jgi:hypothetical protein